MGAAVVIVSVVVTSLEFGVTEAGLKVQPASAGNPVHEKLIGLVNEPCGVTVSVNVPDCPAVTVALLGLGTTVKSAAKARTVNHRHVVRCQSSRRRSGSCSGSPPRRSGLVPAATVDVLFVAPSITVTVSLLQFDDVDLVRVRVHRHGVASVPTATVVVLFVAPSITVTLLHSPGFAT